MTSEERMVAASEALGVSSALYWVASSEIAEEVAARLGCTKEHVATVASWLVEFVARRGSGNGVLPRPWAVEAPREEAEDDGA